MSNANTTVHRQWPFSAARSSGSGSHELLAALLAAGVTIDEISNIEDFSAVERYIKSQGSPDDANKTTVGLMFWLYPTGLKGPYHVSEDGGVEQHGALITVEPGVSVAEAVQKAREINIHEGVVHEHISAA